MAQRLKKRYENAVHDYLQIFIEKQNLIFEYWIGDNVGEIASFGDVLFFNFSDIKYDIDTNQPEGLIIEWLYYCLDKETRINYYSYSKGLRI